MNKWLKIGTLAALIAVIGLAALGTPAAFAQGPPGNTPPMFGRALGLGIGGFGGPQNSLVAVAAKVLSMDQTALIAELNAGKTIADLAKTKNVSVDKIVTAFVDARAQALKAAVDAKRITQAQADATLAAIKTQAQKDVTAKLTPHVWRRARLRNDGTRVRRCEQGHNATPVEQFEGGLARVTGKLISGFTPKCASERECPATNHLYSMGLFAPGLGADKNFWHFSQITLQQAAMSQ